MGLFNFVKEAGDKLWDSLSNKKEEKNQVLQSHLSKMGLKSGDVTVDVEGDVVKVSGNTDDQAVKEKIMLILGNVQGIAKIEENINVPVSATEEAAFYTVKSGDTLGKIAKEQCGNANDYQKIFEANKPMLQHPDKIYPGQVLRIPK